MGTASSHMSLLLLLLFSVLVSQCSSFFDHVKINIQNDIEGVSFGMRCRSYDDFLGNRSLHHGEEWHWEFIEIPGITEFWCEFCWYDNQNHHWYSGRSHVYVAYFWVERYRGYCDGHCQYSARRDGFYLYRHDKKKWEKRCDWKVDDKKSLNCYHFRHAN
ncbi:hypothetical protein MKW94_023961 [Papaver nudicaule]|uniref:S-protein homolog n=1 Tax=Papaver nudicaule TaxID=74823 RepID=A0AA41VIF8_PAPNU|nr:hypothetical protein [Papaver nudicaule]